MATTLRVLVFALVLSVTAAPAGAQSAMPAPPPGSVALSLADYERLVDQADQRDAAPSGAPLAAAVAAAVLDLRVDDAVARGTVAFTGTTLRPGSNVVPLLAGGVVRDARQGVAPVPLVASGETIAALLSGAAPFALEVDWSTAVRVTAGRATIALPATRAGTARLRLAVPGDAAELRLTPGVITARRAAADGTTTIDATLTPGVATEVSWRQREALSPPAAVPVRVVSDVATLITVGDADVRVTALVTLDVSRGALPAATVLLPSGYRVIGIVGDAVDRVETAEGTATVTFTTPDAPRRRFVATLERASSSGSFAAEAAVVAVREAGRERGDLAIEATGTLALAPRAPETLRPIDARELPPTMRAMLRWPVLAAWRYQRATTEAPAQVAFDVTRVATATIATAVAEYASATSLITADGRTLTEVTVRLANARQPFMKVTLPAGSRIVSAELDARPVKPVSGADGLRLPLTHARAAVPARELRYVYLTEDAPFARRGDHRMALPVMDVPIAFLHWEVFVPDDLRMERTGGSVIDAARYDTAHRLSYAAGRFGGFDARPPRAQVRVSALPGGRGGELQVRVVDSEQGVLPGAHVELRAGSALRSGVTNERGVLMFHDVPADLVEVRTMLAGFTSGRASFAFDGEPVEVETVLAVGVLSEAITVTGASPVESPDPTAPEPAPPSVVELQQRVAGVLPLRIDVPRTGRAHRFAAPLVVGDAATVTMRYRRR